MQLLTVDKSKKSQVFFVLCLLVGAVMFLTTKQQDPGVVAAAVVLALVSLYPWYFWLLGHSHGLPLWPVFVAMNGVTAALPMLQAPETLDAYTPAEVITGGMTYAGFIILGSAVWLALTSRIPRPPQMVLMISSRRSTAILFGFVASGIAYYVNQFLWIIPLPGNTHQIVRGITLSLNTMGIFVLAFYMGRGMLTKVQGGVLVALVTLSAAVMAAGLIMATAMVPIAMAFLGYVLGSGRIPWRALAALLVVVAILHPGKYAMRDIYWGGADSAPGVHPLNLPAYYWTWFGYGLEELGGVTGIVTGPKNESEATSVFERAGNVHMLLRVQKMSPAEVPFLNGITYEAIPRLLVPRFIDSDKGVAHAANILLTVNYGLQSMEVATGGTSIAWGLVAEAFANFGYLGIGALAVFLAVFYGLFSRITIGVPMTSLRFVVGLLIMGAAVKADTMALFITSQFQAIIGVSIAALFLMRREANPFAAEDDDGVKSMANGRWQTAGGMPAPGILATLIEGAPAGGAQQGSWSGEHGPGEERTANGIRETADRGAAGPRDVGTGGTVRTLPFRTPKRIASWMPRRVRAAVVAQYAAEGEPERTETPKDGSEKPRQLAVPYQNYRRYRA
jgi:hypothetical protein